MHGRLKVRTSAEEAARKKKEQEEKLKLFRAAQTRIFEKRILGEYDQEMLEFTGKILIANPDVYTMWNIRKECILKFFEEQKTSEVFNRDLNFSENCLQANPKSYGAWHHRCWILVNMPEPNYQREVDLCNKYLKFDERNFHCWDYRRFVTEKANIEPEKELEFCTEKIEKNFSNYSSWHYRSKLLPILFPHEMDKSRPISEEKLQSELELVLTAAFTDPNDSSAWFYQRWLLGYSNPPFDIAAFKLTSNFALIAFTKAVNLNKDYIVTANFTSELQFKPWKTISDDEMISEVWILSDKFDILDNLAEPPKVIVKEIETGVEYELDIQNTWSYWMGFKLPKFEYEFGAAVIDVLTEQLESCNQLLEFEPDSKWTLLTAALLMRAIDRKANHSKTLEYLDKLQKVDELRKGYYQDLASKWSIQNALENWFATNKLEPMSSIDLSGLNLTSIFYENYLVVFYEINLNNNKLTNRNISKFKYLQYLQCLNIEMNEITSLDNWPAMRFLGRFVFDNIDYDTSDLMGRCNNLSYISRGGGVLLRCFMPPELPSPPIRPNQPAQE